MVMPRKSGVVKSVVIPRVSLYSPSSCDRVKHAKVVKKGPETLDKLGAEERYSLYKMPRMS